MSDGGRERASLGVEVWKSSQSVDAERSAVRSIGWLDLGVVIGASPTPSRSFPFPEAQRDQEHAKKDNRRVKAVWMRTLEQQSSEERGKCRKPERALPANVSAIPSRSHSASSGTKPRLSGAAYLLGLTRGRSAAASPRCTLRSIRSRRQTRLCGNGGSPRSFMAWLGGCQQIHESRPRDADTKNMSGLGAGIRSDRSWRFRAVRMYRRLR